MKCVKSSFEERLETYILENYNEGILLPERFLNESKEKVSILLKKRLEKHMAFKYNLELFAEYMKLTKQDDGDNNDDLMLSIKSFNTKMRVIFPEKDISPIYDEFKSNLMKKADEFRQRDSGWSHNTNFLNVLNIYPYQNLSKINMLVSMCTTLTSIVSSGVYYQPYIKIQGI